MKVSNRSFFQPRQVDTNEKVIKELRLLREALPSIKFKSPDVVVRVPEQQPPVVNVRPTDVTLPPPVITIQPAPIILPKRGSWLFTIKRDFRNDIASVVVTPIE